MRLTATIIALATLLAINPANAMTPEMAERESFQVSVSLDSWSRFDFGSTAVQPKDSWMSTNFRYGYPIDPAWNPSGGVGATADAQARARGLNMERELR